MALTVPDQGEPANDLQAVLFQSTIDALVAGDALTGVVSGCAVSQRGAGANMSVDVAAGTVSMLGVQATVSSGNVSIGAADATNPRLDLVVANAAGTKSVLAGTAAANPKEPTLDTTTYVCLAQVYVPAATTSIVTADITDRRVVVPGSGMGLGVYGDGSDGTVTFDGTTTVLGLAPSSSVYTLTRDIFLAAGTINSGVQIKTNGFRIFCQGVLTNNGTIHWNGPSASGTTPGAAVTNSNSSMTNVNPVGGAGGTPAAVNGGAGGTINNNGLGANGGHGGSGATGSGGSAGTAGTTISSSRMPPRTVPHAMLFITLQGDGTLVLLGAGSGGGAGGGDGTNLGGGGGAGGGIVAVYARAFAGTGSIQARGGNGGTPTVGNTGGGGGGGGGWIVIVSGSVLGGAIAGQTIDANGGTAGSAHGTGPNASIANGSNGTVVLIPN